LDATTLFVALADITVRSAKGLPKRQEGESLPHAAKLRIEQIDWFATLLARYIRTHLAPCQGDSQGQAWGRAFSSVVSCAVRAVDRGNPTTLHVRGISQTELLVELAVLDNGCSLDLWEDGSAQLTFLGAIFFYTQKITQAAKVPGRLAEAMNRSGTVLTKHFRSMRRGLAALPGGLHPDSRDEAMHCCVAVAGIIKITAPLRVMDRSMPMALLAVLKVLLVSLHPTLLSYKAALAHLMKELVPELVAIAKQNKEALDFCEALGTSQRAADCASQERPCNEDQLLFEGLLDIFLVLEGILDKSSMSAAANSKLLIEHTNIQKQISTLVFAGVPLLSRFWRAYSTADSEPSVSQRCLNMAFERMYDARNSGKARVTVWTVILNVMNSVNSGPRDDEMGKQLQENGLKGFGEVLKRFDDELG